MNKKTISYLLEIMDYLYHDMQSGSSSVPVGVSLRIMNGIVFAFYSAGLYAFYDDVSRCWSVNS